MMWYWDHGGVSWWGWLLMSFSMVAFWGAVIWGIWYLVTHATAADDTRTDRSPEQILDARFARGEIDADEYRARRDALRAATHRERVSAGDGR